jgi:hypothetical protein
MAEPQGTTPPGWYPDPWAPGAMRWWDGTQWSAHSTPKPPASGPSRGAVIALSVAGVVGVIAVLVLLGVTGAFDSENAEDYAGTEREVALVIDRFEEEVDDDPKRVCDQLLTRQFARGISEGAGKPCAQVFSDELAGAVQANIHVHSIKVSGSTATAEVEELGDDQTWRLVRTASGWQIDSIE